MSAPRLTKDVDVAVARAARALGHTVVREEGGMYLHRVPGDDLSMRRNRIRTLAVLADILRRTNGDPNRVAYRGRTTARNLAPWEEDALGWLTHHTE
jgi:hypothetical protein